MTEGFLKKRAYIEPVAYNMNEEICIHIISTVLLVVEVSPCVNIVRQLLNF